MERTRSFLSRRKLLVGAGGLVAAAAALLASPMRAFISLKANALVRSQPMLRRWLLSLPDANYEEWLEQVGTMFTVGGASLKLVAVTAFNTIGARPLGLRDRAFAVKFDVQNQGTMAGDLIYTAYHPTYGPFPIFLSASSDPNLPHRMTGIFN